MRTQRAKRRQRASPAQAIGNLGRGSCRGKTNESAALPWSVAPWGAMSWETPQTWSTTSSQSLGPWSSR